MAEPMTPEALEAIRARLARVAPSLPWAAVPDRAHHGLVRGLTGEAVADVYCGDRVHAPVIADFIAHAPEDLAALLAEVERLRAREARVRLALVGIDKSVAYATAYHRPALREAHNLIAEALRD